MANLTKSEIKLLCDKPGCMKYAEVLDCEHSYSSTYKVIVRCHDTTEIFEMEIYRNVTLVWSNVKQLDKFWSTAAVEQSVLGSESSMLSHATKLCAFRDILRGQRVHPVPMRSGYLEAGVGQRELESNVALLATALADRLAVVGRMDCITYDSTRDPAHSQKLYETFENCAVVLAQAAARCKPT